MCFMSLKKKNINPLLYDIKGFSNYQLTFLTIKAKWNNWTLGVRLDWAYFCWNWKYCNEIIFKCMNSIVGSLFNKKVTEKWNLWNPWTVHQCTVHGWLGQIVRLEQKKEKNETWFSKRRRVDAESKWALEKIYKFPMGHG